MAEPILLYPFRNRLKRGISRDEWMLWLEFLSPDIVKFEDDFIGAFDTTKWGEHAANGSVTGTVTIIKNGICRLESSVTSGGYCGIFPNGDEGLEGAAFIGENSPVIWARVTLSAITAFKAEVGFTDADDDNGGAVNLLATPSCYADDCAMWCIDSADETNIQWQGVHRAAAGTAAKVEPDLVDVAATTYEWLGVAILGDKVKFMHADQYGNPDYESGWQAAGITADDPLVPWLYIRTRGAASRKLDIDYVIAYQRRTSTDD